MVQSITNTDNIMSLDSKNNSKVTDKDNGDFANALGTAQTKLEEQEKTAGTSGTKDKKSDKDLVEEFKSACMGFSFCGKCGAMYRGTSVAECVKCGHDMSQDNENSKKLSGADKTASSTSTTAASGVTQSVAKI